MNNAQDEHFIERHHGRGSGIRPDNRFVSLRVIHDTEQLTNDDDQQAKLKTEYYEDASKSVVSENKSPDIPFRFSLNPYRGCVHGCSYCYARPSHEYLGMDAGLDFESKIIVKRNAPDLFRDWLNQRNYKCEPVMLSGVTDCYQPIEKKLKLTRRLLEIALEAQQPIRIITKNALINRDLDILSEMAKNRLILPVISLATIDKKIARKMEPRTSTPQARLRAIEKLTSAGIPTGVLIAPIIPGLTDSGIPSTLKAARDAGATYASRNVLRLPLSVEPVFLDWLHHHFPLQEERVLARIRQVRGGELNSVVFGERMSGTGIIGNHINQTFNMFRKQLGYLDRFPTLNCADFSPPTSSTGQQRLF
ncbi:MAG: radical SAM protein [Planctomycetaceae bacterium]|nr:radical SAM protein [Planctomycetaceae bacterium]|tara:strand:+ start:1124 stop:2212 length:1089 start_codon:yes stop_codon:yes gene_type:complete